MQGKKIDKGAIEGALNRFLEDGRCLVMGFEKDGDGIRHRVFKDGVDNFSLMNPVFGTNGALYLRRLFAKGAQIVLMLRPCEIRAYVLPRTLSSLIPLPFSHNPLYKNITVAD